MDEPATCYVGLDEKELRSIITRRAQALALASRENASSDKLHDMSTSLFTVIYNLGDFEKKKKSHLSVVGALIDDEIPL